MRPSVAASIALIAVTACAAPDPVVLVDSAVDTGVPATDPTIRILFPDLDDNGQVNLELSDACAIEQLFVFDVDFFELLPPAENADAEGQGHIHLTVGPNYLATNTTSVIYSVADVGPGSDVVPDAGGFGVISATLQENNHDDLNRNQFPDSIHNLEYVVTDPSGNCL